MPRGCLVQEMTSPHEQSPTQSPPSCRLWVLLASRSPSAVIFRRGPSEWIQLITWNTANDSFVEGQWFNGIIDPSLASLSPDGQLLIYGARKYSGSARRRGADGCWSAISRPPFLTALAWWSHPGWAEGGGTFLTPRRIMLYESAYGSRPQTPGLPKTFSVEYGGQRCRLVRCKPTEWQGTLKHGRFARTEKGSLLVSDSATAPGDSWREIANFSANRFKNVPPSADALKWPR